MNILPTLVQEVVGQCKRQGFVVSAALVQFFIRTQLLTATKDAQNNVEVAPDQVESLVNSAVRVLTQTDSALLETYKLQASVTTAQQEQINKLRTERIQHRAKAQRLLDEICAKRDAKEVFGEITLYILHESSPAHIDNEAAQRETMATLETVFPRSLMDSFIGQPDPDKVRQLEEIWRIVWGIRLYNFFTGKGGGASILDLATDVQRVADQTTEAALKLQDVTASQSREYSAVLACPSLELQSAVRLRLQDELYNRLQLLVYARSLLTTLGALRNKITDFEPTWKGALDDTTSLVQGVADVAAVPKAAIYPRFIAISERWTQLSQIHREAMDASALLSVAESYLSSFTPTINPSDIDHALAGIAPEKAPNREAIAAELAIVSGVEYLTTIPPDKLSRLEFNGFCVVAFVDDGVLLEAKTDEAITPGFLHLAANGAYYGFSSVQALLKFSKDPFRYLSQKLMDLVAATPVLTYLLGLHPYIPREIYLVGSRKLEMQRTVERGDGVAQTGHIDSYKDTHYVWSEWELRRLALQLAALRSKRTKSTQTNLSHFKRENQCQVYLPKTQGTQTLLDAAIQPPRVVRYIKGLRGTADSRVDVVEKTFHY